MINYYLLTKPGIILGNLITVTAGFLLASKGTFNIPLFLATILGLSCIMASACVFNNYIDRKTDAKMERTKKRPLVLGLISSTHAVIFGIVLGCIGAAILFFFTNFLTLLVAAVGFFVYVVLYSLWKSRTIYGTAIGSIAGAVPPVVGYCAVSNHFDTGALILFIMMVFWQMPHFFAIAMSHLNDYTVANLPVLPVKKGVWRTKIHMTLYILGFILSTMMLTLFHYTGFIYLTIATIAGILWLGLCLNGFRITDDKHWGNQMFRLSLVIIAVICFTLPFDIS